MQHVLITVQAVATLGLPDAIDRLAVRVLFQRHRVGVEAVQFQRVAGSVADREGVAVAV